ncbi:aminotransferase class I/II-fold pyridoxal phosphate-dependent enzyme, partial [bacterium]|nr:aminotransferase class I/II-fold pyridoxal phosphate-dependent enzyme [bacterium]
ADRLKKLPPYIFLEIDRLKKQAIADGVKILDFGIGDPDIPTSDVIVQAMDKAIRDADNHRYPLGSGKPALKKAFTDFYKEKYSVELDPGKEATTLIGAKEGVAHMALAFVNPGETVLMPDPAYPVYYNGTVFAGGEPHFIPMTRETDYLMDLEAIPESVLNSACLMWINFPHSPTGTCATPEFFEKVVWFAKKYGFGVCHDAAYIDLTYDGYKAPSFLATPGAKEVGCEIYSMSKPFNMTGWRIGFAAGNEDLVKGVGLIKGNIDSGQFGAVQDAARVALENHATIIPKMMEIYTERRNVLVEGLTEAGWKVNKPKGTIYLWMECPEGEKSMDVSARFLKDYGILATPGVGLGLRNGEGNLRLSLTTPTENCREAARRLREGAM